MQPVPWSLIVLGLYCALAAGIFVASRPELLPDNVEAIVVSAPEFERAIYPAVYLTCSDGWATEAIPEGEWSLVVRCVDLGGAR